MQEKEAASVPVDDSQPKCALSGEKFEKFWHDQYQVCCAWCMVADINDAWSCSDLLDHNHALQSFHCMQTPLQPSSDACTTVCRSGDTRMQCKLVLRMLLDMACKKVLLCWKAHWQEHLAAVRMPCQIKSMLHQKKQRYGQICLEAVLQLMFSDVWWMQSCACIAVFGHQLLHQFIIGPCGNH